MSSIKKSLCSATARRGIISIIVFTVVWEICTRLHVPIICLLYTSDAADD